MAARPNPTEGRGDAAGAGIALLARTVPWPASISAEARAALQAYARQGQPIALYRGEHALSHPYLWPVFEAMPHGRFFAGPEDDDLDREVKAFVAARWA